MVVLPADQLASLIGFRTVCDAPSFKRAKNSRARGTAPASPHRRPPSQVPDRGSAINLPCRQLLLGKRPPVPLRIAAGLGGLHRLDEVPTPSDTTRAKVFAVYISSDVTS